MAVLVFVALILAMAGHSSGAWCVCKEGSDAVLQKTLDYACGAGADCSLIKQNGACFNPNNVRAHCNYAVNSYFQKKGQAPGTCDFAGTASPSTSNPSTTGCVYPSSASATTGTTTTPTTPSTTTPMGSSPLVTTPSTGAFGNAGTGLGPSGINTDESDGGITLIQKNMKLYFLIPLMFLGLGFLWG